MTVKSKGYLRHVALSVADPWETAEFYKQTVGLEEVSEIDGPLAEGVFLTDGVVNLAILHFKSDEAARRERGRILSACIISASGWTT